VLFLRGLAPSPARAPVEPRLSLGATPGGP
jgi:hypothetical protein